MLQRLHALVAPALATRLTLLLNHVLSAERVATERLVPHAGRTVALTLQGWPSLLPPPPVLAWRITPAGLLEGAVIPTRPRPTWPCNWKLPTQPCCWRARWPAKPRRCRSKATPNWPAT
jgi:hypothetical protein